MEISELKPVTKTYTSFKLDKEDSTETIFKNLDALMVFGSVTKILKTEDERGNVDFKIYYYPKDQSHLETFETNDLAYTLRNVSSIVLNDYRNEASKIIGTDGKLSGNCYMVRDDNEQVVLMSIEDDLYEIK